MKDFFKNSLFGLSGSARYLLLGAVVVLAVSAAASLGPRVGVLLTDAVSPRSQTATFSAWVDCHILNTGCSEGTLAIPSLNFTANTVNYGDTPTLTWTSGFYNQNNESGHASYWCALRGGRFSNGNKGTFGTGMPNFGSTPGDPVYYNTAILYDLYCYEQYETGNASGGASVRVSSNPPPAGSVTLSPTSVTVGQSATIQWNVQYADTCRIAGPGVDLSYSGSATCAAAHSTPTPAFAAPGTNTYTLTYATDPTYGTSGSVAGNVTVTCPSGQVQNGATCAGPSVSITASSPVAYNGSSNVTFTSSNVQSCTWGINGVPHGPVSQNGSFTAPEGPLTANPSVISYTCLDNAGVSRSSSASVTVNNAPTVSPPPSGGSDDMGLFPSLPSINSGNASLPSYYHFKTASFPTAGGSDTIGYYSGGATSCTLDTNNTPGKVNAHYDNWALNVPPTGYAGVGTAQDNVYYSYICTFPDQTDYWQRVVYYYVLPTVGTNETHGTYNFPAGGGTATIGYNSTNATNGCAFSDNNPNIAPSFGVPGNVYSTFDHPITKDQTQYTYICYNGQNDPSSQTITFHVAPAINSFTTTPSSVTGSGTTNLSWATTNAQNCTLNRSDNNTTSQQPVLVNNEAAAVSQTTTFTLACTNSIGQSVSQQKTVTVNAPTCANGLNYSTYGPSCSCPANYGAYTYGISGSSCVQSCANGISISTYPSCSCPSNYSPSGSSCIQTSCANGLNFSSYPACACPAGQSQQPAGSPTCTSTGPALSALVATPPRVQKGANTTLSWTGVNLPATCSLSSSPAIAGLNGSPTSGANSGNLSGVGPINLQTVFTLTCGSAPAASATVTVVPTFIEI